MFRDAVPKALTIAIKNCRNLHKQKPTAGRAPAFTSPNGSRRFGHFWGALPGAPWGFQGFEVWVWGFRALGVSGFRVSELFRVSVRVQGVWVEARAGTQGLGFFGV